MILINCPKQKNLAGNNFCADGVNTIPVGTMNTIPAEYENTIIDTPPVAAKGGGLGGEVTLTAPGFRQVMRND